MRFPRIENALAVCKKHLKNSAGAATANEVESYLVSYLLVIIYAEFEGCIRKIVEARIARIASDREVHTFIRGHIGKVTGRIGLGDLGDSLAKFGLPARAGFYKEVQNQPPHVAWDSIMNNRHAVAHPGGTVQITLVELETAYNGSQVVLAAFARACGLEPPEIAAL